ncbi:MAG TPA: hypothetical protein VHZ73_05700 [Vicinamibacterales bacterium]|nr:hypothetical protein [Vicinamibacterales bacterium]
MSKRISLSLALAAAAVAAAVAGQQPPAPSAAPPQQPDRLDLTITGDAGRAPRFAIPDFVALSNDRETLDAARTIGRVLQDDLNFEHEFQLVPHDVTATVPAAKSIEDVPFAAWRELDVDGVVIGTVQKTDTGVTVQVRAYNVRTHDSPYNRELKGSIANPRLFAHTISDQLLKQMRALNGVAQTKLVFASDRDDERLAGTVENRQAKELYVADYDGENQRRVTVGFHLNNFAEWSPDARSIAYTSWSLGPAGVFVQHLYEGLPMDALTKSDRGESVLPAWSPDGNRIAFASNRDGNYEIYVMNKDGSNVRRLTNNPAADSAPTWSPNGQSIAFTSDRNGGSAHPQIWIMDADGLGQRQLTRESAADRPTWSPAPYNEIAYAGNTGPGFDIKVIDVGTGVIRQLTSGEGDNESPAFAPNGRHIAFNSTRAGRNQVFTINRMGQDLKQLTKTGTNERPNWSNGPAVRN